MPITVSKTTYVDNEKEFEELKKKSKAVDKDDFDEKLKEAIRKRGLDKVEL